ncbi:uncharacterized protein BXZ73DRAFT_80833 [Epithele typhae]|uniref:uncharacterized protein n=1 Tax=Epithele typhae TaxID=378194 RepID=UPI002008A334|nr:uncharacterized protein BXZ73DRAFT_80833 [Epithele typhae]KAH9917383.1 hypothetical protein BXZ73DRAFT_80833 [Epithele typhae]
MKMWGKPAIGVLLCLSVERNVRWRRPVVEKSKPAAQDITLSTDVVSVDRAVWNEVGGIEVITFSEDFRRCRNGGDILIHAVSHHEEMFGSFRREEIASNVGRMNRRHNDGEDVTWTCRGPPAAVSAQPQPSSNSALSEQSREAWSRPQADNNASAHAPIVPTSTKLLRQRFSYVSPPSTIHCLPPPPTTFNHSAPLALFSGYSPIISKANKMKQKTIAENDKGSEAQAAQKEREKAARASKKELADAARAAKKEQENAARAAKKELDKAARDGRRARREQQQDGQPSLEEEERTMRRINLPPTNWNDLLNHCARVVHSMSLARPSDNVTARTVKAFGKAVAARWSGYVSELRQNHQAMNRAGGPEDGRVPSTGDSASPVNQEQTDTPISALKLDSNVEFTFDDLEDMLFSYAARLESREYDPTLLIAGFGTSFNYFAFSPKCKKVRHMVLRTIQQINEVKSGIKKEEYPEEPCLSSPDPRMTRAMSREPKTEEPEEIDLTHIDRLVDGDILADITLLLAEYKKTLVRLLVLTTSLGTNPCAGTRSWQSNDGKDFAKLDTVMNRLWKCPPAPSFDPTKPPCDLDEFKARIAPWVPKAIERLSRETTRYEASLDAVVGSLLACNFTADGGYSLRAQWKLNQPWYLCATKKTSKKHRDSLGREVSETYIIPEFTIICLDEDGKPLKVILVVEDKRTANPVVQLQDYAAYLGEKHNDLIGLGCRLGSTRDGDGIQALICSYNGDKFFGPQHKTTDVTRRAYWYSIMDDFILETLFNLCRDNWRLADKAKDN